MSVLDTAIVTVLCTLWAATLFLGPFALAKWLDRRSRG